MWKQEWNVGKSKANDTFDRAQSADSSRMLFFRMATVPWAPVLVLIHVQKMIFVHVQKLFAIPHFRGVENRRYKPPHSQTPPQQPQDSRMSIHFVAVFPGSPFAYLGKGEVSTEDTKLARIYETVEKTSMKRAEGKWPKMEKEGPSCLFLTQSRTHFALQMVHARTHTQNTETESQIMIIL